LAANVSLKGLKAVIHNTNQYKDVIAQREFSASEARPFIAPA